MGLVVKVRAGAAQSAWRQRGAALKFTVKHNIAAGRPASCPGGDFKNRLTPEQTGARIKQGFVMRCIGGMRDHGFYLIFERR